MIKAPKIVICLPYSDDDNDCHRDLNLLLYIKFEKGLKKTMAYFKSVIQ